MHLVLVPRQPVFRYICQRCRERFTSLERQPVADLDGEPYQAYYCEQDGNVLAVEHAQPWPIRRASEMNAPAERERWDSTDLEDALLMNLPH